MAVRNNKKKIINLTDQPFLIQTENTILRLPVDEMRLYCNNLHLRAESIEVVGAIGSIPVTSRSHVTSHNLPRRTADVLYLVDSHHFEQLRLVRNDVVRVTGTRYYDCEDKSNRGLIITNLEISAGK